jgi:hypothetical protein
MPIIASPDVIYQHATTTKTLVKAALRKIGALSRDTELSGEELQDALEEMNRMLDNWNTERLLVHVLTRNVWTIASAVDQVEIGSGGSLDVVRPQRIEQGEAYISEDGQEYELSVWLQDRWARITDKSITGRPYILYYEPSFPLGLIRFYPKTDQSYDFILYIWQLLGQVSNVEQSLNLPPGYADAITHELAIRLAPEYGKSASRELGITAAQTKANIKRINNQPPILRVDSALIDRGRYDITSGDYWPHSR